MKQKNKGQVSMEFMIIFSLIFFTLVAFIAGINKRVADLSEQQETLAMKSFSDSIKSEILLASSVSDNYIRRFNIPYRINGKLYKIDMINDDFTVSLFEQGKLVNDYYTVLPISVKGRFVENISINTTDHCITKNNYDGIRVSRNQASLDPNATVLKKGDRVDIMFSLNCIENILSAQITIKYDPSILNLESVEPATRFNKEPNWLFEDAKTIDFKEPYVDSSLGRYTLSILSKTGCATGSGNVAKFSFKVKNSAPIGDTIVRFDKEFSENDELKILDCFTNKETKESLPDSRYDAFLEIIN